jgi:hypothetical protein
MNIGRYKKWGMDAMLYCVFFWVIIFLLVNALMLSIAT